MADGVADMLRRVPGLAVVGSGDAGKLTTVGAIDAVDTTETFQELAAHFDKRHDITLFGAPGCMLYTSQEALFGPVTNTGGSAAVNTVSDA